VTDSCRDNARRYLNAPDGNLGADTILLLWECVIGMCPDGPYLVEALDWVAGFYDYHGQPQQAQRYWGEAARLRNHLKEVDQIAEKEAYWFKVAEATLDLIDQHKYAWAMLRGRLPTVKQYHMRRGDLLLTHLRSELESEMFRAGGPQNINVFYPEGKRVPRVYQYSPGRRPLTEEEWRDVGSELDRCLACSRALTKLFSGKVRVDPIDRTIKYHGAILRQKVALEPIAQKQIGSWSPLYPEEAASRHTSPRRK